MNSYVIFINIGMVDYLHYICVWIIINQEMYDVWITHKITIGLMRKIVITQRTNNCTGICRRAGVKGFLSILGVDNINLASLDDHLPNLDFVFYFETWYDGRSANAENWWDRKTAIHFIDSISTRIYHHVCDLWVDPT